VVRKITLEVNLVQHEEAFDHIRRVIDPGIVLRAGGEP
jgi:hypothetical protein